MAHLPVEERERLELDRTRVIRVSIPALKYDLCMLLHVHVSLFHNARIKVLKIPQHVIVKKIPMTLK